MALSTFSELKSSIADFLDRDDLTSVIPDFITLAEAQINREIRHWRMEKRSQATVSNEYTALPSDWLEAIQLDIQSSDTNSLKLASRQAIADWRQSSADTAGVPAYYALADGSIELYPTPNDDYTIEMLYFSRISALSDSNTSNWVLAYHPDLYLYGSLLHSAPYLSDDVRVGVWSQLYAAAREAVNYESSRARHSGAGLVMKNRGYA